MDLNNRKMTNHPGSHAIISYQQKDISCRVQVFINFIYPGVKLRS